MSINNILTFDVMSDVKSSEDIAKEFGRYMQTERTSRGLLQKFVADKMGLSETQLSRLENGKSGTERDTVIKWAQIIGIDANTALRKWRPENNLFAEQPEMKGKLKGLLRTTEKMTPEDKDRFLTQSLALAKTYFPPDFDFDYIDDED